MEPDHHHSNIGEVTSRLLICEMGIIAVVSVFEGTHVDNMNTYTPSTCRSVWHKISFPVAIRFYWHYYSAWSPHRGDQEQRPNVGS